MAERPLNERRSSVGRLYDQQAASLYRYALMLLADPAATIAFAGRAPRVLRC